MGRPLLSDGYLKLIATIREVIPDVALTTDVITGFPGETEEHFKETLDLVHKVGFAGGHVFTYSPRPGTAAYKMKENVSKSVAKGRNATLRKIFDESARKYRKKFIGSIQTVLWETSRQFEDGSWHLSGLTDTYIRIYATADIDLWNRISSVRLEVDHPQRNAVSGEIILSH